MMETLGVSQPEVCFLNLTNPFFTFHFFFYFIDEKSVLLLQSDETFHIKKNDDSEFD